MGSLERFTAMLLEHTGGIFPTWLAPTQVVIVPIAETHVEYAHEIAEEMKEAGMRPTIDASNESLGKRIRAAKMEKTPYVLVIGDQEVAAGAVSVESRTEKIGSMSRADFLAKMTEEIKTRS